MSSKIILNPLCAKFFRGNIKHIFTFYVIPPHWYDTGGWNPSSNKTRTYPFYIINVMAAGVLATQGAAMLFTQLNRDNSVPACKGLTATSPRGQWVKCCRFLNTNMKVIYHGSSSHILYKCILTCWFLGDLNEILDNFQVKFSDWWPRYLSWNCSQISQHWLLVTWWHQTITWAKVDPDICRRMASPGHNVLTTIFILFQIWWRRFRMWHQVLGSWYDSSFDKPMIFQLGVIKSVMIHNGYLVMLMKQSNKNRILIGGYGW